MEGFRDVVHTAWNSIAHIENPFKRLMAKLNATTRQLVRWSDRSVGSIKMQILVASEVILRLDVAMESRELSAEKRGLRNC